MAGCRSEYGGSFEAGAGTLRLYVHAVALARAAADAAQQAMEKEFQAIDALKERLQVGAFLSVCSLFRCLGLGLRLTGRPASAAVCHML